MQEITIRLREKGIDNSEWSTGKNGEGNKILGSERCENINNLYINNINNNNPMAHQLTQDQNVSFDCWYHVHLSTDRAEDHPASLGLTYGQPVVFSTGYWLSRSGLPPHISTCPNSSQCCFDTDPIHWPSNLPPSGIELESHSVVRVQNTVLWTALPWG